MCKFNLLNTFCARRRRTRTVCNNLSEMCTHLATATATAASNGQQQEQPSSSSDRGDIFISHGYTSTHKSFTFHRYLHHTHTQCCSYGYIYTDTDTFINMSPGLMCQLAIFDSLVPTKRPPSVCLSNPPPSPPPFPLPCHTIVIIFT